MTPLDLLLGLAPAGLRSHRRSRFDPGRSQLSVTMLPPAARAALAALYVDVRAVREAAARGGGTLSLRLLDALDPDRLIAVARALAVASADADLSTEMLQALHDARGGALVALVAQGERLHADPTDLGAAASAALLAADHARLMRGAFFDLDPAARAQDLAGQPWRPADLVRGLGGSLPGPGGRRVALELLDLAGDAAAACALEAAALGRLLANHLDNAARFSCDGVVRLTVLPVGGGLARWVAENTPDAEQHRWLLRETGGDLAQLYRGGRTRGGEGLGLAACAALVAACFGLPAPSVAVREGYLGARLDGGVYYAWWHWPGHGGDEPGKVSV